MILDKVSADKKLRRMALEVAERNFDKSALILIGIRENGIHIARKIGAYLQENFTGNIEVLELWLDKKDPGEIKLSSATEFNGKSILLIDDVANSGRTMLYALKPLLQHKPSQIETLALLERTHKKFPVSVDYVGMSISTGLQEHIVVDVENGEITGARFG